jgi:hypothetical protein
MEGSGENTQQQDMHGKTNGELMMRYYNASKVEHDDESASAAEEVLNDRNFWNTETNPRCNPNWVYLGH